MGGNGTAVPRASSIAPSHDPAPPAPSRVTPVAANRCVPQCPVAECWTGTTWADGLDFAPESRDSRRPVAIGFTPIGSVVVGADLTSRRCGDGSGWPELWSPHAPQPVPVPVPERVDMNPTWHSRAACRGLDPSIFYPPPEDEVDAEPAKAVCDQCPVREACLEHALALREKDGVWGGCTERERRRIVRQRRRSA